MIRKYDVNKVYIDGANPSFIRSLKLQMGEDVEYDKVIARAKTEGIDDPAAIANMKVVPVNFNKESKPMLGHCKLILESDDPRRIAINPVFDKLLRLGLQSMLMELWIKNQHHIMTSLMHLDWH
jgi:hypothetical protein